MHPDADAFLDAIFAAPDDDTPRLVYADWLAEHGQEHYAQFIRLQCAAAREKLWSDAANHLWEEIGRVWPRLADEWWPATRDEWEGLESHSSGLLDAAHFHRGFLRPGTRVTAGQLVDYPDCWAWLPTPETKLVVTFDCDPDALAARPILRRVRSVRCEGDAHPLVDFLWSPHLCAVTHLNLSRHRLTPPELDALMTAPNLASVTHLKVYLDPRDWSHLIGGCLPQHHEAARKLRSRFPNVRCDIE
jgi:uncharacterized protein (TIGR02996 family)